MANDKCTPKSVRNFLTENKGTATICGDSIQTVSAITSWLTRNGWEAHYLAVGEDIYAALTNSHVLVVDGWDNYDEFTRMCIGKAVVKGIPVAQYKINWGFHPHPDSPPFQFPEDAIPPMMASALSDVFKVSNKCNVYSREEEQFNDAIYPLLRKGLPMRHLILVLREYVDNVQASVIDLANEANSSIIDQKAESLKHISKHLTDAYTGLNEAGW